MFDQWNRNESWEVSTRYGRVTRQRYRHSRRRTTEQWLIEPAIYSASTSYYGPYLHIPFMDLQARYTQILCVCENVESTEIEPGSTRIITASANKAWCLETTNLPPKRASQHPNMVSLIGATYLRKHDVQKSFLADQYESRTHDLGVPIQRISTTL